MADQETVLSNHIISELRGLSGRAKVTYPDGDSNYPRVERVVKVIKTGTDPDGWKIAYDTADQEYPETKLKQQEKTQDDQKHWEVYRRYETVPGKVIVSARRNANGDAVTVNTQRVEPDTSAVGGFLYESDTVQASSDVEAVRTTETVTSRAAKTGRRFDSTFLGAPVDVIQQEVQAGSGSDVLPAALNLSTAMDVSLEPIDQFRSMKQVKSLKVGASHGVVRRWTDDNRSRIKLQDTTQFVEVADVPTNETEFTSRRTALSLGANDILEYRYFDITRYTQLITYAATTSQLNSLRRTFKTTVNYRFPNILRSGHFLAAVAISGDTTAVDFDIALSLEIEKGMSGAFDAIVYEYYTYSPDTTLDAITAFDPVVTNMRPRADTLWAVQWQTSASTAQVRIRNFDVPETLRDATDFDLDGDTATHSDILVSVPASIPTVSQLEAMPYIVIDVEPQPLPAGLFLLKIVRLKNPYYTGF